MPRLGLGTSLNKSGLVTPGIVTDSLVLKHNYAAGGVVPVSDGAAFFDGTDDYITMGDVCDLGTADFSISFWAYFPEGTSQEFISKYEDDDNRWFLRSQGEDKLQFFANVGGSTKLSIIETTSVIAENTWQHIAFTCDRSDGSSGGKIYINGILTRQAAGDATDIDNDGNLEFGRQSTTEMGGYMCNFGIWSAVLTQPQIKSIMWKNYAGLTSSEKTNLVSWWNLDEGYDEALHNTVQYGTVFDNHHGGSTSSFGSEMVSNGDFSNGTTGWSKQNDPSVEMEVINEGLELRITSDSGVAEYGMASTEVNFVVGKTYKIEIDIISATNATDDGLDFIRIGTSNSATEGASGQLEIHNNTDAVINTAGTHVRYYKHAGGGDTYLWIGCRHDVTSFIFDNVSVKEVLGNTGQTL
jgi:hypothetical protein